MSRPFNPDTKRYWPTNVTGEGAASYELNVTDPDFRFPQVWRTNVGVDHQLPGNIVGTAEFIYNKDINGIYYINANLPAAQTTFSGALDSRTEMDLATASTTPSEIRSRARIVMKNQSVGSSWNISGSLSKTLYHGLSMKGAYSYGEAKNTIDPGSTALSTFVNNQHSGDPNNPGLGARGCVAGSPRVRAGVLHQVVLRVRRDDDLGILGGAPEPERQRILLDGQLRVRRRHERRWRIGQRPHLHSQKHVRDELRDVYDAWRHHVHGRPAGPGVRGVYQSGQIPQ